MIKSGKIVHTSTEEEYFISSHKLSSKSPDFFLQTAREHWTIENKLHYIKNRTMDEDRIRATGGYARIISFIRSMAALALNETGKSVNCVQRKISSDKRILINIIKSKSLSQWKVAFL